MSDARDAILGTLRHGLAGRPAPAPESATGIAARKAALMPTAAVRGTNDLVAYFEDRCRKAGCTTARAAGWAQVPGAVAAHLAQAGAAGALRMTPDATLVGLDWRSAGLDPVPGLPDPLAPETVLGGCLAGVAETGSVVLSTGSANGPESTVLADRHIVVVRAGDVVPTIEAAFARAQRAGLPRSLVFATGPSRTGDIEMTIELGAHGARAMHVVIVED